LVELAEASEGLVAQVDGEADAEDLDAQVDLEDFDAQENEGVLRLGCLLSAAACFLRGMFP